MLPVGRADCHLLPRILSTNSGTIHWSSRILRLRTPPSASRPHPLSGGLSGSAGEPAIHASFFGEPLCSSRLRPSHTTLGEPHCSNPLYPTRDSFGELHCSNAFCYVDHSVFRVGPGEAPFSKRRPPQRFPRLPPYVLKSLRGSRLTRFLPVSSRNSISMRSKRISSMN